MSPDSKILTNIDRVINDYQVFTPDQRTQLLESVKKQKSSFHELSDLQAAYLQALMLDYWSLHQAPVYNPNRKEDFNQYARSEYDHEFSGMFDFSPNEDY